MKGQNVNKRQKKKQLRYKVDYIKINDEVVRFPLIRSILKGKVAMAKWRMYRYKCRECLEFSDELLDLNIVEDYSSLEFDCSCGSTKKFILYIEPNGFNTSKLSQSIPDGVRKFDTIRETRKLERTISKAKRERDIDTIVEASKENKDRGLKAKGSLIK